MAHRILVIGSGGSGKSTLAAGIGARTGLPVVHLDALYWRPGWVPTPEDEWRRTVEALVARPSWVMDGNYGGTLDIRLPACDTVVFLDTPRRVCITRVIARWLRYAGRSRPEMTPGCPERITWEFLLWIWSYPRRRRPQILRRLAELSSGQRVHVLRSRAEIASFLEELARR